MDAATDSPPSMPWRLMLAALAGNLEPPEPIQPGPANRHREGMTCLPAPPFPFAAIWCDREPVVRGHLALWADR